MAGTKRRLTEVDNINLQDDEPKALKSQSSTVDANASLMTCELPPLCSTNPQHFASYDLFETHYLKFHSLNCVQCGKTFPSERFLELHITENHDPFAALKQERGDKIYACFVEGCDKLCSDAKKRRLHVIDKHQYPRDFLFSVVNTGIKRNQTSLLKQWN